MRPSKRIKNFDEALQNPDSAEELDLDDKERNRLSQERNPTVNKGEEKAARLPKEET